MIGVGVGELSARISRQEREYVDLAPLVGVGEHVAQLAVVRMDDVQALGADFREGGDRATKNERRVVAQENLDTIDQFVFTLGIQATYVRSRRRTIRDRRTLARRTQTLATCAKVTTAYL